MNIQLDQAQADLLRELLDRDFRDLRYEISNTDNSQYKRGLKDREERLRSILDQVGGPLPDQPLKR